LLAIDDWSERPPTFPFRRRAPRVDVGRDGADITIETNVEGAEDASLKMSASINLICAELSVHTVFRKRGFAKAALSYEEDVYSSRRSSNPSGAAGE
jgi:hypothetical protein